MRVAWAGTGAFVASAVGAVLVGVARPLAAGVALLLFAAGMVAFLWAYGIAVSRSRAAVIGVGGLYFLAGDVAPTSVRHHLMAALALQTLTALVTAGLRPYSSLAFGVLVPMFGLGLSGLWGARHGSFAPREGH